MLLPLSKSFQSLKKRLQCIGIAPFELDFSDEKEFKYFGELHNLQGEMSMDNCLRLFDEKQDKMNQFHFCRQREEETRMRNESNAYYDYSDDKPKQISNLQHSQSQIYTNQPLIRNYQR